MERMIYRKDGTSVVVSNECAETLIKSHGFQSMPPENISRPIWYTKETESQLYGQLVDVPVINLEDTKPKEVKSAERKKRSR